MPRLKLLLAAPAAALLFAAAPAAAQSPCGDSYTVRPGDTLYSIAQRCRAPIREIMAANPFIRSPARIEVGWRLALPGAAPPRYREDGRGREDRRWRHEERWRDEDPPRHGHERWRDREGWRDGGWRRGPDGRWYRPPPYSPGPPPYPDPDRANRGPERITGVITREGVECPALRTDRGDLYTLAGDIEPFAPGDRVTVTGPVAEVSFCQQGTTIEVRSIRAANWFR